MATERAASSSGRASSIAPFQHCSPSWRVATSTSANCGRTPRRSKTYSFTSPAGSFAMSNIETTVSRRRFGLSPSLVQLSSVRFKEFIREPEALFWTFAFPVLLAIGLGIAFRNRPAEVAHIAVVGSTPEATRVATAARADAGLAVEQLSPDSARVALRTGRVALLVLPQPDGSVQYQFDETRPDARAARLVADNAIQRGSGRGDVVKVSESHVRERGSRYIDFVIPGLLGMNIMGSSIWGLGYTIVDARRKHLLKRLVATPMSRAEFLISYLLSRIALLVGEVIVLLGFAALFFGVPVRGSLLDLAVV